MSDIIPNLLGFYGNVMNLGMQQEEHRRVREFAQKNIDITREREDNAIQRQVADLKLAGINPLMASGLGGAAAAMTGSPVMGNIGADFSNMGNMWLDSKVASKQGEKIDAEIKNLAKTDEKIGAEIIKMKSETSNIDMDTSRLEELVTLAQEQIKESKQIQGMNETIAKLNEKDLEILTEQLNQMKWLSEDMYDEKGNVTNAGREMILTQLEQMRDELQWNQGRGTRWWTEYGTNTALSAVNSVISAMNPLKGLAPSTTFTTTRDKNGNVTQSTVQERMPRYRRK